MAHYIMQDILQRSLQTLRIDQRSGKVGSYFTHHFDSIHLPGKRSYHSNYM